MNIHLVYFSATYTTRTVCRGVAKHLRGTVVEHDITNGVPAEKVVISADDLLVLGMPVYCGRIPQLAAERLMHFEGQQGKAIALAVYGNREFDDALMEMSMWMKESGFQLVAAAGFIGRHCIFPTVATERPDAEDERKMQVFAEGCLPLLEQPGSELSPLVVPGNAELPPYKQVPYCPMPTDSCTRCGLCAELCPYGAISKEDVSVVDVERCMACGRCVMVCPQQGRQFAGDTYTASSERFTAAYSARKEPVFFYAG